jgi:hypothetical protein
MRFMAIAKVTALLAGLLICLFAISSLVLPLSSAARPAARQAVCTDHLKQISVALENYLQTHRCYPPPYLVDGSGEPMHSWRVLILKDLVPDVYNSYNFGEPWNGPNNSKLAPKLASVFSCPNDPTNRNSDIMHTNYAVITGPFTAFPKGKTTKFGDILGVHDETILVAEIANSHIHWMEPRDLDSGGMSFILNDTTQLSISSEDPGGPGIVLVSGAVRRLRGSISSKVLGSMTRITGPPE